MVQQEFTYFLISAFIIAGSFITGIVIFFIQVKTRKKINEHKQKYLIAHYQKKQLQDQLEVKQQTMIEIGKELHDNIGQQLVLASIYLQNEKLDKSKLFTLLNNSIDDLRTMSKTLTDDYIEKSTLINLLHREKDKIESLTNFEVVLDIQNENIDIQEIHKKTAVYRTIQEFLQNSLKHSSGTAIIIKLFITNNTIHIKVSDNGKGFEIDNTKILGLSGIGLGNMQKRIENINGKLTFSSNTDTGTHMKIEI